MRALRYALEEAVGSLWRGRRSGVFSMATIAIALFVLGGSLLVSSNLERLGTEWARAAEMSVYVADEATAEQTAAIERLLAPGGIVSDYEYVSKAEVLTRFKETFADLSKAVDTVGGNPLPASYEVRFAAGAAGSARAVDELVGRLRQAPGVTDVRYDRLWLDRLLTAVTVVRATGLALSAVLTIAAALTVSNVVRLALHARRDEIAIMQLVGAPEVYIRGPFVMEGMLQGGAAAAVALAGLAAVFLALRQRYLVPLASVLNLSSIQFLSLELCVALVAGGMLVGCVGGLVAASSRT